MVAFSLLNHGGLPDFLLLYVRDDFEMCHVVTYRFFYWFSHTTTNVFSSTMMIGEKLEMWNVFYSNIQTRIEFEKGWG